MSSPDVKGDVSDRKDETELVDLPVEVLGLVFDFARVRTQNEKYNSRSLSQPHMSLTATNKHFYDVRRHLYLRLNRKYSLTGVSPI